VGGWALEVETFWGPVKWHQAGREVPILGPPTCPRNGFARIKKHYLQGRINQMSIGSVHVHELPRVTLTGYKAVS
jgi:hypothetical protein